MSETEQRAQIGWQSMSAAGGGGGMTQVYATPTPFADAVARETEARGAPEQADAHRASWSARSGGSTDRLELYAVDAVPQHLPIDGTIPPGTGHVRVEVSVYSPPPDIGPGPHVDGAPAPPSVSFGRMIAVTLFVLLAIALVLGTLGAIALLALKQGGSFC